MGLIRNIKAMADVRKRERDVLASKCTIKIGDRVAFARNIDKDGRVVVGVVVGYKMECSWLNTIRSSSSAILFSTLIKNLTS